MPSPAARAEAITHWTPETRALAVANAEARAGLRSEPTLDDALAAGRRAVTLAEQSARDLLTLAKPVVPEDEQGYSGTPSSGGSIIGDELDRVNAWKLTNRWTTIDKMLGDPDVAAVLWALTLPILSVPLAVEPGSDDQADIDIAATIERDCDNMTRSWQDHRSEALDYLTWGNRVFETVFERGDDGLWHPRKLALRPSETISYWHIDEHGGPDGITQQLQTGGSKRLDMDRLLILTRGRRGGDVTGTSILRPAYGPWMLKDRLAKIGATSVERHGMGVPTLRYTGNKKETKSTYESMLMGLHAHEKSFMLLADGVESMDDFEIKGVSGTVLDPVAQMEYHRRALYSATLTQFLLLGSGDVGSFALSEDQSSFFMLALKSIMREIEDTYNRYLIPRWVGYNWAGVPVDRMPRFKHGTLDQRNVGAWFEAVMKGAQSGALQITPELQRQAHELIGAPLPETEAEVEVDKSNETMTGIQITAAMDIVARFKAGMLTRSQAAAALAAFLKLTPAQVDGLLDEAPAAPTPAPDVAPVTDVNVEDTGEAPVAEGTVESARADLAARRLESEVKLEALGLVVNFDRMARKLDSSRDKIAKGLAPLQKKAADYAVSRGMQVVKSGDPSGLDDIPWQDDRERKAIAAVLLALYLAGQDEATEEVDQLSGVQPRKPGGARTAADKELLEAVAAQHARQLTDRLRVALGAAVVAQIVAGQLDKAALATAVGAPSDALLGRIGAQGASVALGMGRGSVLEASGVRRVLYSAMMDPNTCGECAQMDGQEFDVQDAPSVPNPACAGGMLCRCALIAIG